MTRPSRARGLLAVASVAFSLLALSACAPSGTGDAGDIPELSLAQTKGPVQLLRNEAANRIPKKFVQDVILAKDTSKACQSTDSDPKGLIRSWRSSVRIALKPDATADVASLVDLLSATFIKQGWEEGSFGSATIVELKSAKSAVVIHVSTKKADAESGKGGEIQIQTGGPCVTTAGEDSDEVKKLEAAEAGE